MRNVLLTGGIYHPFAEAVPSLRALFAEFDVTTVVTEDVDEAIEELEHADFFTIHALRWRMLNDDKYAPDRARWAYELPEASGALVSDFVESGGSLLGLHTASICFDTWYDYRRVLGGAWVWDQSFHPPVSNVVVQPTGAHPIVESLASFEVIDEVYHHLAVQPHSDVLLNAAVSGGDWQAVAWAHELGEGRVVYDALGHDSQSLQQPGHQVFLRQAIAWLAGQ